MLTQCTALDHLNIDYNGIGGAGAQRLTESWSGSEGELFLDSEESEKESDLEDEEDTDEGEDEDDQDEDWKTYCNSNDVGTLKTGMIFSLEGHKGGACVGGTEGLLEGS